MKTWHQTSFLVITSKYRPGCTFGLALLQLPQGRGQARRETLVRNHRQRLPVWDEQLVGEGPELQSRAEPAGRIKTQCYHGRTEQDRTGHQPSVGQSVEIGSCGQVVRRDGRGPVTVEGRHCVLPESYSPPAACSSWEDRELWPWDWTRNQRILDPADSHSEPTAALRPTWP